jgi:hypothetical protein
VRSIWMKRTGHRSNCIPYDTFLRDSDREGELRPALMSSTQCNVRVAPLFVLEWWCNGTPQSDTLRLFTGSLVFVVMGGRVLPCVVG